MTEVIGVRFRHAGKVYYFSPGELQLKAGDNVIVETARGIEYGEVRQGLHEVEDSLVTPPLKEVLRAATPEDTAHEMENREKEKEAFRVCKSKIAEKDLDMKLIYCEYTFDNSKILFYFTSDGRVDFRDLVKELAGIFRTRIELRQVGVRDETKLLGGLGSCGRPLCCTTYLSDFAPVSIKMAKEQNLSLNPVKISGVCGRLMCCLGNEEKVYEELNKKLPGVGDLVDMSDGARGEVLSVGILKQLVKVVVELPGDEKEVREYPAEEVTVRVRRREKNRMREEKESRERELRKERERENREPREAKAAREAKEAAAAPASPDPGAAEKEENKEAREPRERRDRRSKDGSRREQGEQKENRQDRENRREGKKENRQNGEEHRSREGRRGENRNNSEDGEGTRNPETQESTEKSEHSRRNRRHRDRRRNGNKPEGGSQAAENTSPAGEDS